MYDKDAQNDVQKYIRCFLQYCKILLDFGGKTHASHVTNKS